MRFLTFIIAILIPLAVFASSSPDVPYYASIKSDDANVRTGPSVRYPIQWVYKVPNWPVEVTATFEGWRKIKDIYGEDGWIHESLLTTRRNAIIKTNGVQEIYRLPIPNSAIVLVAEDGVIASLDSCKSNWCKIEINGTKGWIEEKNLWGIRKGEQFD